MAYNNGFPVNYQQYYPQYQQQTNNNPMIWVQGETGAKSYLLAPNTTIPLWDSESQTIYLKSSDASGMPSMKILDYTIREQNNIQNNVVEQTKIDYVTHEELKEFGNKLIKEFKEETGA